MESSSLVLLGVSASFASLSAGLLGLGGGVVLAPLLFAGTSLRWIPAFDPPTIAGITIIQDLCGSFFSAVVGRRGYGKTHGLVRTMSGVSFLSSLLGGGLSAHMAPSTLKTLIVTSSTFAIVLLMVPYRFAMPTPRDRSRSQRQVAVAATVGLIGGLIGQATAFLLIPLMVFFLDLSPATVVTSSLPITFSGALGGLLGRFSFQPVPWVAAALVLLTAILFTRVGTSLRQCIGSETLRWLLVVILTVACTRVWLQILAGQ
jgi:uncharacterized membrane protein YfcA